MDNSAHEKKSWNAMFTVGERLEQIEGEASVLSIEEIAGHIVTEEEAQESKERIRKRLQEQLWTVKYQPAKRRKRKLTPAIIALALLALISVVAVATGPKYFQQFFGSDTIMAQGPSGGLEIDHASSVFSSLSEALEQYALEGLAPTWIPTRFSLQHVIAEEWGETVNIIAWYEDAEGEGFSVTIYRMERDALLSIQVNYETNGDYEHREIGKTTYYFAKNMDMQTVYWTDSNCLCSISGALSNNEIMQIIESIES